MITPSAAAVDQAVGSSTDRDNTSQESEGDSQTASPYSSALLLLARLLSPLLRFTQPLWAFDRIRPRIPGCVWLSKAGRLYSRFRAFNLKMSNATLRIYTPELQSDLELAYVLLGLYSVFIIPLSGFNRRLFHGTKEYFTPSIICWRFMNTFRGTGYRILGRPQYAYLIDYFVGSFGLLPFIVISLHALFWLMTRTRLIRFIPKLLIRLAIEVDFWLRAGRTVFSIPISLSMLLLPLGLQILSIGKQLEMIGHLMSVMADTGYPNSYGVAWKDSLEDQLYII